jgi:hypothetical protein
MSAPQTTTVMPPSNEPETVVQRQLDAYNARDLEAFMATYAEEAQLFEHPAQLFEHPAKLIASGAAQVRERYSLRFQEQNLHASLIHRIVLGARVMDYERITRTFPEGPGTVESLAIYEVAAGRITQAWFINGPQLIGNRS